MAKSKIIRGGLPPDKYLSREQVERLMRYIIKEANKARTNGSTRAIVNEIIIELLLGAGLRARELCRLQMRDLPLSHSKNVLYIRDSKGQVSRSVMIPSTLTEKIAAFVGTYRKSYKPKTALIPSERGYRTLHWRTHRKSRLSGRMFVKEHSESTSGLSYRSLYAKVKTIGLKSGIGGLHPHMLRHTYGTKLYNREKDLRFVQDQLGHASSNTTEVYTRTEETSRRRQIEGL